MKINRKITILFLLCLFGLGILWYVGDVSEKLRDRLKNPLTRLNCWRLSALCY